jgi:hypothetical protein
MARIRSSRRPAATAVEAAFVLPIAVVLIIALVVGAMGVFRYQESAYLAREAARYASTHGGQFRKDAGWSVGNRAVWTDDIMTNCVQKRMMVLDASKLNVTCSWPAVINQPNSGDNWPGSKVKITVTYDWVPESGLFGAVTFTSVAELPITN